MAVGGTVTLLMRGVMLVGLLSVLSKSVRRNGGPLHRCGSHVGRDGRRLRFERLSTQDLLRGDRALRLVAQDVWDRRRDVALRNNASGHLVQKRLAEVVVGAIDYRHVDVSASQRSRGEQTREATARDHDAMPSMGVVVTHRNS